MPQIEGVCIGGCKHGQWIATDGYSFEVVRHEQRPLADFADAKIRVPMNRLQRIVARIAGIPTEFDRPIDAPQYITEEYQAHQIIRGPLRLWVFIWSGLDKNDPSIPHQALLLLELRKRERANLLVADDN